MAKQVVRLTESELVNFVKKVIRESFLDDNSELVYSTNPDIKTRMSEYTKTIRKGMEELPEILNQEYNDIFARYYDDSEENDEYFRKYPDSGEVWYEQLKKQFEEEAERTICTWVANNAFGSLDVYYQEEKPKEYDKICNALIQKLLPYKWKKLVNKQDSRLNESIRRELRKYLR